MTSTLLPGKLLLLIFFFTLAGCGKHRHKAETEKIRTDSLEHQVTVLKSVNRQLEENKKLVLDLYQEIFGDKNIDAVDKYIGDPYIQHNPSVADGREALREALKVWFKDAPKEKIDVQHIGADGNFVYIHTKSTRANKTYSVMDIFRVEGGKVVEHWDVIQEVPAKSANDHPMF